MGQGPKSRKDKSEPEGEPRAGKALGEDRGPGREVYSRETPGGHAKYPGGVKCTGRYPGKFPGVRSSCHRPKGHDNPTGPNPKIRLNALNSSWKLPREVPGRSWEDAPGNKSQGHRRSGYMGVPATDPTTDNYLASPPNRTRGTGEGGRGKRPREQGSSQGAGPGPRRTGAHGHKAQGRGEFSQASWPATTLT